MQKIFARDTDYPWFWILTIAALLVYLVALGNLPLRDWDEGTYAIISREMYRSQNWLYPTLHGAPFWEKPPLVYWLIAGSYSLGGVSEWTTRLPLAIASALAVPLVYGIGRNIFARQLPAIFSAVVYLTLLPVVRHGRLAMHDGISVTCFLFALWCLLKGEKRRIYLLGFGVGMALLTLSKGILVLLLGAIALMFLLIDSPPGLSGGNRWYVFKSWYFWLGIGLSLIPVAAWYGLQIRAYGNVFIQVNFFNQSFDRISQVVHSNTGPPWYYLLELIKYSMPWLLFLPGGIYLAYQQWGQSWSCLVLLGLGIYFLPISLMGTKLPWYIIPLYPFVAWAVGAQLTEFWQQTRQYSRYYSRQYSLLGRQIFTGIFGLLTLGGVAGLVYFVLVDRQVVLILMAINVILTMGLVTILCWRQNHNYLISLAGGLYLSLVLLMCSRSWLWELNEAFPVYPVAALVKTQTPPNAPVYTSYPYHRPSLNFYSDRRIQPQDINTLNQLWTESQPYLLLDQPVLEKLNLANSQVLGTAEGFTLIGKR